MQKICPSLRYPFDWEHRRPMFHNDVFFVPEYYTKHSSDKFTNLQTYFGNKNPMNIEYCSGNGEWIIDKALKHPNINWIGVEMWFARVKKIYAKMIKNSLKNLLIVSGEGYAFTKNYLQDCVIDNIFINFPDPWPKDKHAKHRLIQQAFVLELKRIAKKNGTATFVTDSVAYKNQMLNEMIGWNKICYSQGDYGTSFFDRLWRSKGLEIHYLCYENS